MELSGFSLKFVENYYLKIFSCVQDLWALYKIPNMSISKAVIISYYSLIFSKLLNNKSYYFKLKSNHKIFVT